jgi:hypothetical protein
MRQIFALAALLLIIPALAAPALAASPQAASTPARNRIVGQAYWPNPQLHRAPVRNEPWRPHHCGDNPHCGSR